jgi:hypothetical protein
VEARKAQAALEELVVLRMGQDPRAIVHQVQAVLAQAKQTSPELHQVLRPLGESTSELTALLQLKRALEGGEALPAQLPASVRASLEPVRGLEELAGALEQGKVLTPKTAESCLEHLGQVSGNPELVRVARSRLALAALDERDLAAARQLAPAARGADRATLTRDLKAAVEEGEAALAKAGRTAPPVRLQPPEAGPGVRPAQRGRPSDGLPPATAEALEQTVQQARARSRVVLDAQIDAWWQTAAPHLARAAAHYHRQLAALDRRDEENRPHRTALGQAVLATVEEQLSRPLAEEEREMVLPLHRQGRSVAQIVAILRGL